MRKFLIGCFALLLLGLSAVAVGAPIDINTAEAPALAKAMKGVGTKKAEAIVVYRKKHGPFKSVDELAKVKGISKKTIEANREKISVGKNK